MNNFIAAGCLGVGFLWFCVVVGWIASRNPSRAWALGVLAIFLAFTRFRRRDADASLHGEIDQQVIFELGMFLAAAAIVVVLILLMRDRLRAHGPSVSQFCCMVFCMCAIMSSTWSVSPTYTAVRSLQATILLALAVVGLRLFGTATVAIITSRIVVGYALVMAGLRVASAVGRGNASHLLQSRFKWVANHPVDAATCFSLAALFVLAVFLFRRKPRVLPVIAIPLFSALFVLLVLTRSRVPLFMFLMVAGVLVGSWFLRVKISGSVFLGTLVLTLLFSLISLESIVSGFYRSASGNALLNTYVLRDQSVETLTTLTGRTEMWAEAVEILAKRPFLGCGYQASRQELLELAPWMAHAHNGVLALSLDLGVFFPLFILLPFLYGTLTLLRQAESQSGKWWTAALGAIGLFLFLQTATDPGFAGPPGVGLFLVFICANASSLGGHGEPDDYMSDNGKGTN